MSKKHRRAERKHAKDAELVESIVRSEGVTSTPMERFKALTRQIIGVTREQMKEQQERYDATKDSPRGSRQRSP
jgi:hypothetical protein